MITFGEYKPGYKIYRVFYGSIEEVRVKAVEKYDDVFRIITEMGHFVCLDTASCCQKVYFYEHPNTYYWYFSDFSLAQACVRGYAAKICNRIEILEDKFNSKAQDV